MANALSESSAQGRASDLASTAGFGAPPDAVAAGLKVGQQWGAYWLHGDGMMRLFPPHRASVAECLETLAHELECDPGYSFECLSDLAGETFKQKLDRVRRVVAAAERSVICLRKWAPECFPSDANGQVHFARALMESVADDLDGIELLPSPNTAAQPTAPETHAHSNFSE